MASAADLRRLALALEGVEEQSHFDRAAFRARKIFVTLAAEGLSANFAFTPDEQALKCAVMPEAFAPIPNARGQRGWTVGTLARLSEVALFFERFSQVKKRQDVVWRSFQFFFKP